MKISSTRFPAILAICAAVSAGPSLQGGPLAPAVCEWDGVARVVAVGDVHGDCDRLVRVLQTAGLIDGTRHWRGGEAHLVQVGDITDRGPASREAMDLLMRLEGEAEASGGRVHALIGNHEAMHACGSFGSVHPGEPASYGGPDAMRRALSQEGTYGRWIAGHNAIIRINDTLFLHGGLSPDFAETDLVEINERVRAAVKGCRGGKLEGILRDSRGPLWFRGLAEWPEDEVLPLLEKILSFHDARRIVMGHTIQEGGIRTRCGGAIVLIDTGMSQYYENGPPAFLVLDGSGPRFGYHVTHPVFRREPFPAGAP